jgi:hypothetical protein
MPELTKRMLTPSWCFPFRLPGKDCVFVAEAVWGIRWQRDLTRQQKLLRSEQFARSQALRSTSSQGGEDA